MRRNAFDNAIAFEALLRRQGIRVEQESVLERVILDVFAINYGLGHSEAHAGEFAKSLSGFGNLARLVLSVEGHASFPELLPHLRILNDGEVRQTARSPASDQVANKLFELYIACIAMRCGVDVCLDNPQQSQGNNPDVLATFNGVRWGIACKVLHGAHPQTILDLVASGVEQIDRSEAATGIVMVNLKNWINHDYYWPPTVFSEDRMGLVPAFASIEEPLEGLAYDTKELGKSLRAHASDSDIEPIFRGHKSIPAFAFVAQTTAMVVQGDETIITSPHVLNIQVFGPVPMHHRRVLECLVSILGEN